MRPTLTFTILATCVVLLLGAAGCEPAHPWQAADEEIGVLAQGVVDKADRGDVAYFTGLTAARDKIPDLMRQIERSGLATTYAEHLRVESDTDATLVYNEDDDIDPPVSFTIQMSMREGEPSVDQIVVGEVAPTRQGLRRGATPDVSGEETVTSPVSVAIPYDKPVAGTFQSALLTYMNTSKHPVWVSQPLKGGIVITYTTGEPVSDWGTRPVGAGRDAIQLAPLESLHRVVRFRAPGPGRYLLYGFAEGVASPVIRIQALASENG